MPQPKQISQNDVHNSQLFLTPFHNFQLKNTYFCEKMKHLPLFHIAPSKTSFWQYLLSLFLLTIAYLIGNFPASFFYLQTESTSPEIYAVLQQQFGSTFAFALVILPWVCVFFGFLPIARYVLKWKTGSLFTTRPKFDTNRFIFAFLLWFSLCLTSFWITKNENVYYQFELKTFVSLFFVASVFLFFQCAAEELLFRSFLLKWFSRRSTKIIVPVLASGIIFGFLHASNPEIDALGKFAILYYIETGIFLAIIAVLDRGIELTTGFHYANNLFAALIVSNEWQVFQTNAIFLDANVASFTIYDFLLVVGTQIVFFIAQILCYKRGK